MIDAIEALNRPDLFAAVKNAVKSSDGSADDDLCPAGRNIANAVRAGWFLLPAGRNGAYSKAQYFPIFRLLEATPWHKELVASGDLAAQAIKLKVGETRYQSLWSHPQGLRSPTLLAKGHSHRNPRMPFEWKAGEITVDLLVLILRDSFTLSTVIRRTIEFMTCTEALTHGTSIAQQIDDSIAYGQAYSIKELLQSTRRMFLDTEASRALSLIVAKGHPGEAFESFLTERQARAEDSYREAWKDVYGRIHFVARVFEHMSTTSEHLGTVNRRLKTGAGPAFKMLADETSTGDKLTLSLGGNYTAGRHVHIQTHWEFRNWVMALSEILTTTTPSFEAYMAAEAHAKARIDLAGGYASTKAAWRPHDDFEDVAPGVFTAESTQHQRQPTAN